MDSDEKTKQIHSEIRKRIYEPLLGSMNSLSHDQDGALKQRHFSTPDFLRGNVMQFMNWLVNEQKEINLIGIKLPLITTGKSSDDGETVKQEDRDYIEKRKNVLKGELIKIADEFEITLDKTRGHVADFTRGLSTARKPMLKAQEA